MSVVEYAVHGAVAVVALNNPPVNALSRALCAGIMEGFRQAAADPAVRAIVVIGRGRQTDVRVKALAKATARQTANTVNV